MTKQWIGIEEAADKYQISAEHIREWSKGKAQEKKSSPLPSFL